jgi:hypothetical protein
MKAAARWLSLSLLALAGVAGADEALTPERLGELRAEEQRAVDEVAKAHGNKKASEMTREERDALIRDQAAASSAVLQKHGVDPKDYARASAKLGREGAARAASAQVATQQAHQKEQEAAKVPKPPPPPVQVQRGISDQNPAILEELPGADPVVETGIPVED